LYDLTQDLLAASLFPLGEQIKAETRRIAAEFGLKTADKPESQDLCLVETHGSMQSFLDKYITPKRDIVDQAGYWGNTMAFIITIGQRKGLGIAAAAVCIGLDAGRNRVIVGDRTSASQPECTVQRVNWVTMPNQLPRSEQAGALSLPIGPSDGASLAIPCQACFDEPQFSITAGQAAVWYDGDIVLGGGIVK